MKVKIPYASNKAKCIKCGRLMVNKWYGHRCSKCGYEQLNKAGREFAREMNTAEE